MALVTSEKFSWSFCPVLRASSDIESKSEMFKQGGVDCTNDDAESCREMKS